jgi:polysaccharide export outer membrane protein
MVKTEENSKRRRPAGGPFGVFFRFFPFGFVSNFEFRISNFRRLGGFGFRISGLGLVLWLLPLAGCGDQVRAPTDEEVSAFQEAGAITPMVDLDRIEKAKLMTGPYRVVPGDVLEFTMPSLLQAVTAAEVQAAQSRDQAEYPYLSRVRDDGTITLPAVGSMNVAGLSLAQIEEQVTNAYQSYVVLHPSVFVRVAEYKLAKVYITGAVVKPGVYTLRADQMSLSTLLTEAGGISEAGAAIVRLVRSGSTDPNRPTEEPILLPVLNANIPYRDISLDEGDTVVAEPVQMPLFSVLGLVKNPGNFPYPPTAEFNLMQAIAYAGGLDPATDPRYATIYRLRADGSIVRVPFPLIQKGEFTGALSQPVRPGDLVAIEHTPRTRMNAALRDLFRINMGLYVRGEDLWGDD